MSALVVCLVIEVRFTVTLVLMHISSRSASREVFLEDISLPIHATVVAIDGRRLRCGFSDVGEQQMVVA